MVQIALTIRQTKLKLNCLELIYTPGENYSQALLIVLCLLTNTRTLLSITANRSL